MMLFLSVADCCRRLSIDPKTFHRWLQAAQLCLLPHPTDGRCKGLPSELLAELAAAHRRTLAPCQTQPPAQLPTSRQEAAPPRPAEAGPALGESPQLMALLAQLSRLHEQLCQLGELLTQLVPPLVVDPVLPPDGAAAVECPLAERPAASDQQGPVPESPSRPPARVLPLVEYGRDGHYVVICPKEGRLGFEPDSPEWFVWLASRSSFRFVGKAGRFTAHREADRLPNAVWRAHRKVRNHTYNQRLAHTPGLTSSVLEQAAATLQAHLT